MNKTIRNIIFGMVGLLLVYQAINYFVLTHDFEYEDGTVIVHFRATDDWGLMQAAGYNISLEISNKKSGETKTYQFSNDRLKYQLFIQDIWIDGVKRKLIILYNIRYESYVFFDYNTAEQIMKNRYDFYSSRRSDDDEQYEDQINTDPVLKIGSD